MFHLVFKEHNSKAKYRAQENNKSSVLLNAIKGYNKSKSDNIMHYKNGSTRYSCARVNTKMHCIRNDRDPGN